MPDVSIPPATAAKLNADHPVGTRHKAAMDIAIPLIGNGLSQAAVFAELRGKFPSDVTDKELEGIVSYAASLHPTPTTGGNGFHPAPWRHTPVAAQSKRSPVEQVDWWTNGARLEARQVLLKSPAKLPESAVECAKLVMGTLYSDTDRVNIVTLFTMREDKANPQGAGKTMTRAQWQAWFEDRGIPQSEAGAWMRFNPVEALGSGKEGAVTDDDVTAFRYFLIESDLLPLSAQLSFYTRLRLPVALIELSGGKSAHAWIKCDCSDAREYKALVERVLAALKDFGIDQANKNSSRLSRLPGAVRKIGAVDGGEQKLLWLNPHVGGMTEADCARFEESLKFPSIEEQPMKAIAERAIERYEELMRNVGKNGVPTGIVELDDVSGGWKKGQTIVVSGHTGKGKTTFALHAIITALAKNIGVALFSLEMDVDEIFDLLMCHYAQVNRNKFNTGRFTQYDIDLMTKAIAPMAKIPLYIDDSPMLTADDIRVRVHQLKAENKIGMVVVDYLQFVNTPFTRDNRELQVATISHTLRSLAREVKLPMLVLSQLNDEGKIRESRVISHNANVVLTVEIDGNVMKVEIVKARGIPYGKYQLSFDPVLMRVWPNASKTSGCPANPND